MIRDVRVFDGERSIARATVIINEGIIHSVSAEPSVETPSNDRSLDGTGCTLLPGLIDSHVHAWGPLERTLRRYPLFGVTTAFEMECDADGLDELHGVRREDTPDQAQLLSSGWPVTVTGGHGTEFGWPAPTVDDVESMQAFVDARVAEGSDYIKIMYNDAARSRHTLTSEMVQAAVTAAHARGKLALVHVNTLQTARSALACGADGLAHLFMDRGDAGFGRFVASSGRFVIPTLTVLQSGAGEPSGAGLSQDPRVEPFLTSFDRRQMSLDVRTYLQQRGTPMPMPPPDWGYVNAQATLRQLLEAGVPILAGTDAPNPGTTHGASIHRELELLVEAGMSGTHALAAATSVPARCFGLDDRGRIAPGLRADLLLVRGDPTANITATRDIVGVWKAGVRLDRVTRE